MEAKILRRWGKTQSTIVGCDSPDGPTGEGGGRGRLS